MDKKKTILIAAISLILTVIIFSFGYFYFFVDRIEKKDLNYTVDEIEQTEKMAMDFVQQNLKEEFWPLDIQITSQPDNTFLASWALEQTSFTVSGEISRQKKPYAINIFIPDQKTIVQNQEAQKIFESYFIFSTEFICEELQMVEKQIFRCHGKIDDKLALVMTEQDFEANTVAIILSIMELIK